jgi:hypothetical protein
MTSRYTFTWHARERVLDVQLSGAWTLADIESYYKDLTREVEAHAADEASLLVDLTDYPVQDGPVADAMQINLGRLRESSTFVRVAVALSPRATSEMQTRRIASGPSVARSIFHSDRASAWAAVVDPVSA